MSFEVIMKVFLTLVQIVCLLFGVLCVVALIQGTSDPEMLPVLGLFFSGLVFFAAGRGKKNLREAQRRAEGDDVEG